MEQMPWIMLLNFVPIKEISVSMASLCKYIRALIAAEKYPKVLALCNVTNS